MKKSILMAALAGAVMAACNSNSEQNDTAAHAPAETVSAVRSSALDLYGKTWRLAELKGKPIVLDTTFPKQPQLIFDNDNRVSGNLGCNGFGGNLKLQPDNGISITEISATQMACPNLAIEHDFLEVLQNAESFRVEQNTLFLYNAQKEAIARLQVE